MRSLFSFIIFFAAASCTSSDRTDARLQEVFARANDKFVAQQQQSFPVESDEQANERRHRYVFGNNVAVTQYESLLQKYRVSESNEYEVHPQEILFGVPSVSDKFSRHTLFYRKLKDGKKEGLPLTVVEQYVRDKVLDKGDLPVHVVQVNDQIIAISNQELAVLTMLGVQPSKIIKHSLEDLTAVGPDSIHMVLTNLDKMPGQQGSASLYIRGEGANLKGETRKSFAWDAPFIDRLQRQPAQVDK